MGGVPGHWARRRCRGQPWFAGWFRHQLVAREERGHARAKRCQTLVVELLPLDDSGRVRRCIDQLPPPLVEAVPPRRADADGPDAAFFVECVQLAQSRLRGVRAEAARGKRVSDLADRGLDGSAQFQLGAASRVSGRSRIGSGCGQVGGRPLDPRRRVGGVPGIRAPGLPAPAGHRPPHAFLVAIARTLEAKAGGRISSRGRRTPAQVHAWPPAAPWRSRQRLSESCARSISLTADSQRSSAVNTWSSTVEIAFRIASSFSETFIVLEPSLTMSTIWPAASPIGPLKSFSIAARSGTFPVPASSAAIRSNSILVSCSLIISVARLLVRDSPALPSTSIQSMCWSSRCLIRSFASSLPRALRTDSAAFWARACLASVIPSPAASGLVHSEPAIIPTSTTALRYPVSRVLSQSDSR